MLGELASREGCGDQEAHKLVDDLWGLFDFLGVPVDTVPEDVLDVDGAHKELEHKLKVAHTEKDALGSVQDISCFGSQIYSKPEN